MKYLILLLIIPILFFTSCKHSYFQHDLSKTDYVYLKVNDFMLKNEKFFPIMINYVVCIRHIDSSYFISPIKEYENPEIFETNTKDSLINQIRGHLQLIKDMGFNSIRLIFDRVNDENGEYYYQADNKRLFLSKDYDIITKCLADYLKIVSEYDLKVMLLIKAPVDNIELKNFTEQLLTKLSNNSTLFAYDFFNEPLYFDHFNLPPKKGLRAKKDVYKIVSEWKAMMNKFAPNQLLTIGLTEPIEVFEWDPSILPVDFISFHTYNPLRVPNEIYWYSKYTDKPWMIGETSLPADDDSITYDEQRQFLKETYHRIRDCGGSGLGWWEFQELSYGTYEAKHTALINLKGITKTKDGKYSIIGTVKPAVKEIAKFNDYKPKTPLIMANYYNMMGYNNIKLIGKIINSDNGKPIEGAVIRGWTENWIGMNTFTDEKGVFTLYSNNECVHFEISAPKMNTLKFDYHASYTPLNNNNKINFKELPDKNLEYNGISYKKFLLSSKVDSTNSDFQIFNFDPLKFKQAKFVGFMKDIYLKPVAFL